MSDVYKIGVQLALTGNMSAALAGIASQLVDLDHKTTGLMAKWEKLSSNMKLAVGGAVATGAGVGLLDGLLKIAEHGEELVHIQQQLTAATQNQQQVAEATAKSWELAERYGLRVSSVLSDIKEARMVFGSTEHAMDFIDPLEKMRVVLNGMTEGSGNKAVDAVYNMARAGELKGLTDPADFIRYFDGMTKAITASGGKVDPDAFMQATQYGKLASKGWNEEFYTRILPSMIQEMRPSTAGQSLMSLYGTIAQGRVTQRALGEMSDLGLIGDPDKVIYDKQGNPKGFNPDAIVGTDLFVKNPFEWAQTVLKPLVEKKLGHEVRPGDEEAINLLGGMFGNRNSAAAIATLLLEGSRIKKDAGLIGQAQGLDAADNLFKNDPKTAVTNFKSAWDNLLTALGSPLVPGAINAMNSIANVFKSITAFAAANPDAIRGLGKDAAIAGGVLAAGGTAAMSASILRTLFGAGGLNASAAALNTSAVMLQQAAVSLGAKGVTGVGGGPGGLAGQSWFGAGFKLIAAYEVTQWLGDVMGNLMKAFPHPTKDIYGRDYDPAKNESMGIGERFMQIFKDLPRNDDGSIKWFDRKALNQSYREQGGTASSTPPPPPPVNVNQQTQVSVKIDGQDIRAYITSVVTKAVAGFSSGAPTPNSGAMMPAVDGGG